MMLVTGDIVSTYVTLEYIVYMLHICIWHEIYIFTTYELSISEKHSEKYMLYMKSYTKHNDVCRKL